MARMIPVNVLYEQLYLKFGYDDGLRQIVKEFLDELPKEEAIPMNYIFRFMENRDPVYKSNLMTMIDSYRKEEDESESVSADS